MPFSESDVIDQESVRARVEQIAEENLQFRQVFRQVPAPPDAGDNFKIPVPDDTLGEPEDIKELEEYPHDEEGYTKVQIDRQKIGQVVPISDEAQMDNLFDVQADHIDRMGRKLQEGLDGRAFEVLDANLNATTAGSDADDLTFAEVTEGLRVARADGYNPDTLIIDSFGEEDLLNDNNFNRATQSGDSVVRNGVIARAAGMNVVVSNTGDMTQHDAYVVDSDFYGYEGVWSDVETDTFREDMSDVDYLKIRVFRGWQTTDASAAVKVLG